MSYTPASATSSLAFAFVPSTAAPPAAIAIDLSTTLGHAFIGFLGSSGPNRVTVLALLAPLLRMHQTHIHIGRGRARGAVGGRGVGSLGVFGGSVNANGPGLNTDTAALGTCQMRPHEHSQIPGVVEWRVAVVEFAAVLLEGQVSPGGNEPPNERLRMWVESVGVLWDCICKLGVPVRLPKVRNMTDRESAQKMLTGCACYRQPS